MNRRAWIMNSRVPACLAAAALAAAGGCAAPARQAAVGAPAATAETTPADLPTHPFAAMRERIAGRSVEDRPIEVWTIGTGDVVVLIIASIHGDEAAGTPLLERLAFELRARPELVEGRTVVLVPQANPDGVALGRRTNVNGVDLNRNFPASNYRARRRNGAGPLSEPESRALHDLILDVGPDRVISMHQPLQCIDFDGPRRNWRRR
jgi:protein MpaA